MVQRLGDLDEQLAVGSCPATLEDVRELRDRLGVRAVVSLQSDEDLGSLGIQWDLMWRLYTLAAIRTSRVPIVDFNPADLKRKLDEAVTAIAVHISDGRKVYVHCTAGMNRSPTVVAAYVCAHRGLPLEEALKWLTQRYACMPYPDVLKAWCKGHRYRLDSPSA
jgi:hypothetical protein